MNKKCIPMLYVCAIAITLLVAGCVTFQPVATGELVGTWEGTVVSDADGSEMQVEFEFKNDGTFSEKIVGTPIVFSGTYEIDMDASTINVVVTKSSNEDAVPVGASFVQDVVISGDKGTFKASGSGSTGTFTRK